MPTATSVPSLRLGLFSVTPRPSCGTEELDKASLTERVPVRGCSSGRENRTRRVRGRREEGDSVAVTAASCFIPLSARAGRVVEAHAVEQVATKAAPSSQQGSLSSSAFSPGLTTSETRTGANFGMYRQTPAAALLMVLGDPVGILVMVRSARGMDAAAWLLAFPEEPAYIFAALRVTRAIVEAACAAACLAARDAFLSVLRWLCILLRGAMFVYAGSHFVEEVSAFVEKRGEGGAGGHASGGTGAQGWRLSAAVCHVHHSRESYGAILYCSRRFQSSAPLQRRWRGERTWRESVSEPVHFEQRGRWTQPKNILSAEHDISHNGYLKKLCIEYC